MPTQRFTKIRAWVAIPRPRLLPRDVIQQTETPPGVQASRRGGFAQGGRDGTPRSGREHRPLMVNQRVAVSTPASRPIYMNERPAWKRGLRRHGSFLWFCIARCVAAPAQKWHTVKHAVMAGDRCKLINRACQLMRRSRALSGSVALRLEWLHHFYCARTVAGCAIASAASA